MAVLKPTSNDATFLNHKHELIKKAYCPLRANFVLLRATMTDLPHLNCNAISLFVLYEILNFLSITCWRFWSVSFRSSVTYSIVEQHLNDDLANSLGAKMLSKRRKIPHEHISWTRFDTLLTLLWIQLWAKNLLIGSSITEWLKRKMWSSWPFYAVNINKAWIKTLLGTIH